MLVFSANSLNVSCTIDAKSFRLRRPSIIVDLLFRGGLRRSFPIDFHNFPSWKLGTEAGSYKIYVRVCLRFVFNWKTELL
jgi:hypothetical protein